MTSDEQSQSYLNLEPGLFGTPLTTLVDWDKKRIRSEEKLSVPLLLSEILSFLEKNGLKTEGILRKCGSAARMKLLKQVLFLLKLIAFR